MCEDVGRDWQAKELCGESGSPFQRPVDSRIRLSTWRGVRRDESDGVGTRKALQKPGGCPHLARAAHPATGPPTKEQRATLPIPSKKCVRAVRLMA